MIGSKRSAAAAARSAARRRLVVAGVGSQRAGQPEDRRDQRRPLARAVAAVRGRHRRSSQDEFEPRQRDIHAAQPEAPARSRTGSRKISAVMGEEERTEPRAADPRRSTRPAAHAERVSRGSQRAAQRGARQAAARGAAARCRSTRARRSSTSCSRDAIFVSSAVDITRASARPCSKPARCASRGTRPEEVAAARRSAPSRR